MDAADAGRKPWLPTSPPPKWWIREASSTLQQLLLSSSCSIAGHPTTSPVLLLMLMLLHCQDCLAQPVWHNGNWSSLDHPLGPSSGAAGIGEASPRQPHHMPLRNAMRSAGSSSCHFALPAPHRELLARRRVPCSALHPCHSASYPTLIRLLFQ